MQLNKKLLTAACALSIAGLPGTAALADDTAFWCDKDDGDCESFTIDLDGDAKVFFIGDGEHGLQVRMPHLNYSFGAFGGGGYMGVSLTNLTTALREHFGVPDDAGVLIAGVEEDSPAFEAGVEVGDIVTAVDGEEVESSADLSRLVRQREEGDTLEVELYRDGRLMTLDLTIAERQRPQFNVGNWIFSGDDDEDGDSPRHFQLDIDPDALRESMQQFKKFQTYWNSDAAGKRVRRFSRMESDLADKLEALESRIRELETQIEER